MNPNTNPCSVASIQWGNVFGEVTLKGKYKNFDENQLLVRGSDTMMHGVLKKHPTFQCHMCEPLEPFGHKFYRVSFS